MSHVTNKKKGKNNASPENKVCSNCFTPKGSVSCALKLSACARCGLVVYCSRDCQRAHWKANHKQYCIAKADRAPRLDALICAADSEAITGEKCAICQDFLSEAVTSTLPCAHVFHYACVAELRKFGVEQNCPLCRIPLPPGSEKIAEDASRRYMVVHQLVKRGHATWSSLPASAHK